MIKVAFQTSEEKMDYSVNHVWIVTYQFGKQNKMDPFFTPYTTINFRWRENMKVQECKAVEEKYGCS